MAINLNYYDICSTSEIIQKREDYVVFVNPPFLDIPIGNLVYQILLLSLPQMSCTPS